MELCTVVSTSEFLLKLWDAGIHTLLEISQSLSHSTVQGNHGTGTVGLRTNGTELKTVASESEWRGTVTVGIVDEEFWNLRNIHLQALFACHSQYIVLICLFDMVEQFADLLAKE